MNMKTITEKAYGKINLYLDVLDKRSDGYHDILSVMHTVELCDTVTVSSAENGITMTCTDPTLSCGDDNLCIKAAKAFFDVTKIKGGCHIVLKKILPMGAGMGGGSADAAAVLRALNKLYDAALTDSSLCDIGRTIGADVPFCIVGGCKKAEGIGEVLTDHTPLPNCAIVICEGGEKISTPEAYRQIDAAPAGKTGDYKGFTEAMKSGKLREICKKLYNRFEDTSPECRRIKNMLTKNGAKGALMTGSGSAVLGIFTDNKKALRAKAVMKKNGVNCFVTRRIINIK